MALLPYAPGIAVHRFVALMLLSLLLVQGLLPERAMACATEESAAEVHAHHQAEPSVDLPEETEEPARTSSPASPSHDAAHCLMAACVAPGLAAAVQGSRALALPDAVLGTIEVVALHSATAAPDTPPPRA